MSKEIKYVCDIHGGKFEKPEQVRNEIGWTDKEGNYVVFKDCCDGCLLKVKNCIEEIKK